LPFILLQNNGNCRYIFCLYRNRGLPSQFRAWRPNGC